MREAPGHSFFPALGARAASTRASGAKVALLVPVALFARNGRLSVLDGVAPGMPIAPLPLARGRLDESSENVVAVASPQSSAERAAEWASRWDRRGLGIVGLLSHKALFVPTAGDGFVAYSAVGRVALALGDPVASPEALARAASDFKEHARAHGFGAAAFFEATREALPALKQAGFCALPIGAEPVVRLSTFDLRGRAHKTLRSAYNRGRRAGVDVFEYPFAKRRDPELDAQIREVAEAWTVDHGGQSVQAFTDIDPLDPALASAARIFVAMQGSRLLAFSVLTPISARCAWNMHLARRRPDAAPGTMEVLDVTTLEALRDEGAELAMFGMCPLEHLPEGELHPVFERAMHALAKPMSRVYQIEGISAYKAKFVPEAWEPRYLAYTPRPSAGRVLVAITRAQVPGGLRALLRAPRKRS